MANEFVSVIKTSTGKVSEDAAGKSYPVLPVRDTVLFPHAVLPLTVGRESSIQLIQSLGDEKTILVVAQRDARLDAPGPDDLHLIGTERFDQIGVRGPQRLGITIRDQDAGTVREQQARSRQSDAPR